MRNRDSIGPAFSYSVLRRPFRMRPSRPDPRNHPWRRVWVRVWSRFARATGIGSNVIRGLQAAATRGRRPLTLSTPIFGPNHNQPLYEKLGFVVASVALPSSTWFGSHRCVRCGFSGRYIAWLKPASSSITQPLKKAITDLDKS